MQRRPISLSKMIPVVRFILVQSMILMMNIFNTSHGQDLNSTSATTTTLASAGVGVNMTMTSNSPNMTSVATIVVNDTNGEGESSDSGVVAASILAVVACIIVVIAVYIIKKRRDSQLMDREKKMQIQMTSARNAGVYQDLTVSASVDEKTPATPEHERLRATEDV